MFEVHPRGGTCGEPLTSYGKAVMEIRLDPLCFDHMCVVADIIDEVLLGRIFYYVIPLVLPMLLLKMIRSSVVRHVTVAESMEVSPMEEVIVDAYMDRHENQEEEEEGRQLVEMHPNLQEAPTLEDVANGTSVPVHLFNPYSYLV